jgi:hypothetical protein
MTSKTIIVALMSSLAISCGRRTLTVTPNAAVKGTGDAAIFPEASSGPIGAPGAGVDASMDARSDVAREVIAQPADSAVAGPCGAAPAPACPATYLGTSVIEGHSMTGCSAALAPDGTIYLGGNFNTPTDFDPTATMDVRTSTGYSDAFLTELAPDGSYGLTATFPGSDYWGAGIWSLSATSGAVVAVGGYNGSIDLDPGAGVDMHQTALSAPGAFAVKLTAAGDFVWGRTITSGIDALVNWSLVAAAPDGSVYLGGNYGGSVDLDPGPGVLATPSSQGAFLTHLDAAGDFAWAHTLGGDACESAEVDGVALGADGASWFAGVIQGTCTFDGGAVADAGVAQTDSAMFIASMTTNGEVRGLWIFAGHFDVTSMSAAPDGSVYVGGAVSAPVPGQGAVVDFDPSPAVAAHALGADETSNFVLKLDQSGAFRWVHLLSDDLPVTALAATPDEGVLVAGGPHAVPVGMFILKLDADQNEDWRLFAGGSTTTPSAVLVGDKEFIVAGTQTTPGDFDPSAGVDRFQGVLSFVSRYAF